MMSIVGGHSAMHIDSGHRRRKGAWGELQGPCRRPQWQAKRQDWCGFKYR